MKLSDLLFPSQSAYLHIMRGTEPRSLLKIDKIDDDNSDGVRIYPSSGCMRHPKLPYGAMQESFLVLFQISTRNAIVDGGDIATSSRKNFRINASR